MGPHIWRPADKGKEVRLKLTPFQIARIERAGRSETGDLFGFQRPQVARHILEIRDYLKLPDSVLPAFRELLMDLRDRTPQRPGLQQAAESKLERLLALDSMRAKAAR